MNITVNGKPEEITMGTVGEYANLRQVVPKGVVIVYNGQVLERRQWECTHLEEGDTLEILSFVGGG